VASKFEQPKLETIRTPHRFDATALSSTRPFSVFADSTTTVNFRVETSGIVIPLGTGNVDFTFGVTETSGQCRPISVDFRRLRDGRRAQQRNLGAVQQRTGARNGPQCRRVAPHRINRGRRTCTRFPSV
jgi:hypothetical protein